MIDPVYYDHIQHDHDCRCYDEDDNTGRLLGYIIALIGSAAVVGVVWGLVHLVRRVLS